MAAVDGAGVEGTFEVPLLGKLSIGYPFFSRFFKGHHGKKLPDEDAADATDPMQAVTHNQAQADSRQLPSSRRAGGVGERYVPRDVTTTRQTSSVVLPNMVSMASTQRKLSLV